MPLELLAPSAGLALPSLAGVPAQMSWGGDTARTLRVLIRELLRADAFTPREGPVREDDPHAMISTGIARLVGVQPDASSYALTVRSVPRIGAALLVTVHSAQFAEWGRVRAALEAQDPGYARWLYRVVQRSIGRLGPLYDYSAAAWNYECRHELMQEEAPERSPDDADDPEVKRWRVDCERLAADFGALNATHTSLMRRGRVPRTTGLGVSRGRWPSPLRVVVDATCRLDRAGRSFGRAMKALPTAAAEKHFVDDYDSGAAAWPLTLVERAYDLVGAAFDEDADQFYEIEHAPNVIIPLDTRSPQAARRGFEALRALGTLLRALVSWVQAVEAFDRAGAGAGSAHGE